MKGVLLLLLCFMIFGSSCKEQPENGKVDKSLLSTTLVNNPHTANGLDTSVYNGLPTMDFKDTVHNFGAMSEGEKGRHVFEFVNNGKTPLIISDAKGSCGCTVADFPREPVAPGATGVIETLFNTEGKTGHQEKSISITTNSQRSVHVLYIKADVSSKQ